MTKIHPVNQTGKKIMNLQDAFLTEIEFWDEMLNSQSDDTSTDVLERIKMARLLAQQKLSLYSAECCERVN